MSSTAHIGMKASDFLMTEKQAKEFYDLLVEKYGINVAKGYFVYFRNEAVETIGDDISKVTIEDLITLVNSMGMTRLTGKKLWFSKMDAKEQCYLAHSLKLITDRDLFFKLLRADVYTIDDFLLQNTDTPIDSELLDKLSTEVLFRSHAGSLKEYKPSDDAVAQFLKRTQLNDADKFELLKEYTINVVSFDAIIAVNKAYHLFAESEMLQLFKEFCDKSIYKVEFNYNLRDYFRALYAELSLSDYLNTVRINNAEITLRFIDYMVARHVVNGRIDISDYADAIVQILEHFNVTDAADVPELNKLINNTPELLLSNPALIDYLPTSLQTGVRRIFQNRDTSKLTPDLYESLLDALKEHACA